MLSPSCACNSCDHAAFQDLNTGDLTVQKPGASLVHISEVEAGVCATTHLIVGKTRLARQG